MRRPKTKTPSPGAELPKLLDRLTELRGDLAAQERVVEQAGRALDEARANIDEFRAVVDVHSAARARAAAEARLIEETRVRDHLADLVSVGEAECLRLVDREHDEIEDGKRAELRAIGDAIHELEGRRLALERKAAEIDADRELRDRSRVDDRDRVRGRRTDWEETDRRTIREYVEAARHGIAGQLGFPPVRLRTQIAKAIDAAREQPDFAQAAADAVETVGGRKAYTRLSASRSPIGPDDPPTAPVPTRIG